jgi:hypothetical protein
LPSEVFAIDLVQEIRSIRKVASPYFSLICFGHSLTLVPKAQLAVIDFTRRIESKYEDVALKTMTYTSSLG